jgi:hypothetical protein
MQPPEPAGRESPSQAHRLPGTVRRNHRPVACRLAAVLRLIDKRGQIRDHSKTKTVGANPVGYFSRMPPLTHANHMKRADMPSVTT